MAVRLSWRTYRVTIDNENVKQIKQICTVGSFLFRRTLEIRRDKGHERMRVLKQARRVPQDEVATLELERRAFVRAGSKAVGKMKVSAPDPESWVKGKKTAWNTYNVTPEGGHHQVRQSQRTGRWYRRFTRRSSIRERDWAPSPPEPISAEQGELLYQMAEALGFPEF